MGCIVGSMLGEEDGWLLGFEGDDVGWDVGRTDGRDVGLLVDGLNVDSVGLNVGTKVGPIVVIGEGV